MCWLLCFILAYFTIWIFSCEAVHWAGCKPTQISSVSQYIMPLPYMTPWPWIYMPPNKREKSGSITLPLYRDTVSLHRLCIICNHFSFFDCVSLKEIKECCSLIPHLSNSWGNICGERSPCFSFFFNFALKTVFIIRGEDWSAYPWEWPSWLPLVLFAFAHIFQLMGDAWPGMGWGWGGE